MSVESSFHSAKIVMYLCDVKFCFCQHIQYYISTQNSVGLDHCAVWGERALTWMKKIEDGDTDKPLTVAIVAMMLSNFRENC